ncbi:hypothetical protein H696_02391 [Fonticula alba]|uniref:3-methylcrotonyl-CoA carboxylase alpha subunit n=1 Tax=Fonticula alba TaxID=691883 RepID=A0A058ZAJ5_FONAL|nr:hypothetical protein H696_02391 [Fonticula alba]KCV71444.1 hypothetical protein H696_02391 [Fonticula alba]|eukprot:XP_009494567.1 hypothetical protein H696_02391 [Fonticula alba]
MFRLVSGVRPTFKGISPFSSALRHSSLGAARYFASVSEDDLAKARAKPLFNTILIANRGEIACRVIRSARRLGIRTVAVYSDADRNSLHTRLADEAYHIGPSPSADSYLRSDRILEVAAKTGAQAIHPGYGFLSENAAFAELCSSRGITFIGPPPQAIRDMGSKSASKRIMSEAGVPVVPGYHGDNQDDAHLAAEAEAIGFPVLIKAVMGGGGKGMRIVERAEDFPEALESARRESRNSFADDRVLVEKYLQRPRHVEVQVFGDTLGNVVHLHERDCSVQRRHQKVIEEAPAPNLSAEVRAELGRQAVAAARAVGYVGAGTVEFIMDADRPENFYFMEMNTRLQVEHPVTELVTGADLVAWQLEIASGRPLSRSQSEIPCRGHSFEARIYAENPENNFMPDTGRLVHLSTPVPNCDASLGLGSLNRFPAIETDGQPKAGLELTDGFDMAPLTRVESGVRAGDEVSVFYDPMIAKLVVWDTDREAALRRLNDALDRYHVVGPRTNLSFLRRLASHPAFAGAELETGFIDLHRDSLFPEGTTSDSPGPISLESVVQATLHLLLEENKQTAASASSSQFPASPTWSSGAFQTNLLTSRVFNFNVPTAAGAASTDPASKIAVTVTYQADGSYRMEVVGERLASAGTAAGTAADPIILENVRGSRIPAHGNEVGGSVAPGGTAGELVTDLLQSEWAQHLGTARVVARQLGDESQSIQPERELHILRARDSARHVLRLDVPKFVSKLEEGADGASGAGGFGSVLAPMPCKVTNVSVAAGDIVSRGQTLMVVEAMKMEHVVRSPSDARVARVVHAVGDLVGERRPLVVLEPIEGEEEK